MNKILSFRINRVEHRHDEGNGLTLVTMRPTLVAWIFGLHITFNMGFHAHE